jgi:AcrR family transcriptional regulator
VDVNLLVGPVADRAPRWDEVQECLVVPTLSVARTDRRVRRTRELLRGALLSLIQEKGYDSITVQDILDRADVGRSTFYAHYRDKDELLRSGFEDVRAALAAEREAAGSRVRRAELLEATLVLFRHVQRYRHLWRPMVQKGGSGLVVRILRQSSIDLVRDHFRSQFPAGAEDQARREAAIHYIVGALMGVLTWWLDNQDVTYSAEELHAMFQRLATEGIRRFLDVR